MCRASMMAAIGIAADAPAAREAAKAWEASSPLGNARETMAVLDSGASLATSIAVSMRVGPATRSTSRPASDSSSSTVSSRALTPPSRTTSVAPRRLISVTTSARTSSAGVSSSGVSSPCRVPEVNASANWASVAISTRSAPSSGKVARDSRSAKRAASLAPAGSWMLRVSDTSPTALAGGTAANVASRARTRTTGTRRTGFLQEGGTRVRMLVDEEVNAACPRSPTRDVWSLDVGWPADGAG